MSTEKDYDAFKLCLNALQEASVHYFNKAQTEKERALVISLMEDALRTMTAKAGSALKADCPSGYTRCPDGSCVPYGMSCK